MTTDQTKFITANQIHFDLVLNHGQIFQPSHDIAKEVIAIANSLEKYQGTKVGNCTSCILEAYQYVWNEYQLTQDKPKKK